MSAFIKHLGDNKWENIPILKYKEEGGTIFKDITRQVLSECSEDFPAELRYFEMAAGGYSTLEKHQHTHMVLIGRGSGHCFVKDQISEVKMLDAIMIPPLTWHQFRATGSEPLGFFCVVKCERDRPQLPTDEDLKMLRSNAQVAEFIRV